MWFKDVLRNSVVIFLYSCTVILYHLPISSWISAESYWESQKPGKLNDSLQQAAVAPVLSTVFLFSPFLKLWTRLSLLFFWGLLIEFILSDLAVRMSLTTFLLLFHYRVNPMGFFVAIMTLNGFPTKFFNSSTVYYLLQTFELCTWFPDFMANPIHVSEWQHQINILRHQKQEKMRRITVYFTSFLNKNQNAFISYCEVFPISKKFRDVSFHYPGKIQLSQPSLYDKIIMIIT